MVDVESGVDLFAFEKLTPTLTDWLVTCHASVPAVYYELVAARVVICDLLRTPRPGVSMPAVTTRFVKTKLDMRNGRNTGSPVSTLPSAYVAEALHRSGCNTWVYRGIDYLLRAPQVWCHLRELSSLVSGDELFRIFETGGGCEKCSVGAPLVQGLQVLHGAIREQEANGRGTHHTNTRKKPTYAQLSHLGSAILAECCTRPQ